MAKQRVGDPGIVNDRDFSRLGLFGIQAADGFFPGVEAYFFRRRKIFPVDGGGIIVITLHAGILAGDNRNADRMAGPGTGLGETVAADHGDIVPAPTGFGTLGIGDAGNAQ